MQAVVALNSYTRWSHSEMMEMTAEELLEWLDVAKQTYKKAQSK
jgi:hypothetical protein